MPHLVRIEGPPWPLDAEPGVEDPRNGPAATTVQSAMKQADQPSKIAFVSDYLRADAASLPSRTTCAMPSPLSIRCGMRGAGHQ